MVASRHQKFGYASIMAQRPVVLKGTAYDTAARRRRSASASGRCRQNQNGRKAVRRLNNMARVVLIMNNRALSIIEIAIWVTNRGEAEGERKVAKSDWHVLDIKIIGGEIEAITSVHCRSPSRSPSSVYRRRDKLPSCCISQILMAEPKPYQATRAAERLTQRSSRKSQ